MPSVPHQTTRLHLHLELPSQNTPAACKVGSVRNGTASVRVKYKQPTPFCSQRLTYISHMLIESLAEKGFLFRIKYKDVMLYDAGLHD